MPVADFPGKRGWGYDGVLLFAHGARDAAWAAPFEAVLARVRELRPEAQVALAFLELMQPDLAAAASRLVQHGCRCLCNPIVPSPRRKHLGQLRAGAIPAVAKPAGYKVVLL